MVTGTDAGEREDLMAKDNSELAILYQVETKTFNHAVKRNIERFPENFRFQLKKKGEVEEDICHMFSQNKVLQCFLRC